MDWIVPRVWEGGTCVVIGGGPSLLQQFDIPEEIKKGVFSGQLKASAYSPYLEPIHNMHVIAVNVAYRFGDWIDVMFFGDTSTWIEEGDELKQWKGLRVTCSPDITRNSYIKHLSRNVKKPIGLTTDPSKISWNYNSGSAAINLAVHFGVKRIILLGFDMSVDDQRNQHWHKIYKEQLKTPLEVINVTMHKHMLSFPAIAADAKKLGVEIINASPNSRIQEFPKLNFKDIKL